MKNFVPESYIRKFHAKKVAKVAQKASSLKLRKERRQLKDKAFKKAEKYVSEYRRAERAVITQKRIAKKQNQLYVPPEAKVAVVVRIRGIMGVSPKVKKILQLLRLRQIHNCVFVKLNKATIEMLRRVEPYIAFGYPNLKTIRELIYKRGFAKINHDRIPLMDNETIQRSLGKHGIICMEDLIHEIATCGPNFKIVNRFFWPFKLVSPRGGFTNKLKHFNEGGEHGNQEDKINELIQRMI